MSISLYRQLLADYIPFESISASPDHTDACARTATWLETLFREAGFSTTYLTHAETNPVVLASYEVDPAAETVLIYGHYDVQPVSEVDAWGSNPFTVSERDGRLYARGVADNKGQSLIHIAAVLELIQQGQLRKNVKFLIEGNEETGSPHLAELLETVREQLTCDRLIISDGSVVGSNSTIDISLRGVFNLTICVQTASGALHSGNYGGAIPNAAHELTRLLASLFGPDDQVLIPGFYKGTKARAKGKEFDPERRAEVMAMTGVRGFRLESGADFDTQIGERPALQVTSLESGYGGAGYANIVPHRAVAKLNVRLAPGQDAEGIKNALLRHLEAQIRDDNQSEITLTAAEPPLDLKPSKAVIAEVQPMLESLYRAPLAYRQVGGSIPIVHHLERLTGVKPLLISLANEDCNMHGTDENFTLDLIHKGLTFSKAYFSGRWLDFRSR